MISFQMKVIKIKVADRTTVYKKGDLSDEEVLNRARHKYMLIIQTLDYDVMLVLYKMCDCLIM